VDALPEAASVQRKILVVDDARPVLETLGSMLKMSGYRVTCVPSGVGALAAARLTSFDAALIDVFMPEMDGFETAIRLREQSDMRRRELRMWHITGMNSPAVEARSAQCGMMGLILKPFILADLCRLLETGFTMPMPPRGSYIPPPPAPKPVQPGQP
jgi:CheY-like chemotaxis protein